MKTTIKTDSLLNFERVEIFLRVKGKLPSKDTDIIDQKLLDNFQQMYRDGELTQGVVNLSYLSKLIFFGYIKSEV